MNAFNMLSNCLHENCYNDNFIKSFYICNATPPKNQSLSLVAQLLSCSAVKHPTCTIKQTLYTMGMYDLHSVRSFYHVWHIQCTIIVTLIATAISRSVIHCVSYEGSNNSFKIWLRYILEYIVIYLPVILSVNAVNPYVEYIVLFTFLMVIFIMLWTKCWQLAAKRDYEFGRRPTLFTLMRSSINILTAVCILAIDFKSFPKEFRKTRRYGVGLMDVGIGAFVFSMGLVASKPNKFSDLRKQVFTVGCLLALGLARTLVISAIDYHQDEHEYGTHLNAFFTLGFTKLLAAGVGFLAKNENHLLAIGLLILLSHETVLQCGVWKYVMNPDIKRNNLINSNREGLCSLPGFIALYMLSQYVGKSLQANGIINFKEMNNKLKFLSLTSIILWLVVILAIFVIGIARVTCNLGYVVWILAISVTVLTFYLFVFDIVLDTLLPLKIETNKINLLEVGVCNTSVAVNSKIPIVIEAVNFNGLTFFLLANIFTGCVNIFFNTEEKTNFESILILFLYMLLTTTLIFILYRFKIRIA